MRGRSADSLAALIFVLINSLFFVGCGPKDPTVAAPEVAVVRIDARRADQSASSLCRGFFVSADGLVVTSLHAIDGAQDITVTRNNGQKLFADFVQGNKQADLALIRVHASDLPFLKLSTDDDIQPGLHVRLLGTAGVTHGTFDHWETLGTELDVTAPMLPTDAGSPLLGDDGQVVAAARQPLKDNPSQSLATPIYRVFEMMPSLQGQKWEP